MKLAVLALATLLLTTRLAHAQEVDPPPTHDVGYRLPMLAADAAAVTCLVAGGATGQPLLAVAGGVLYLAGGPFLHLRHHNARGAAASVALRLGAPALGALIGWQSQAGNLGEDGDLAQIFSTFAGGALGALLAIGIDDLALAHHHVRDVTPIVVPGAPGNLTLGFAGRF